jgi:hypothetical protein
MSHNITSIISLSSNRTAAGVRAYNRAVSALFDAKIRRDGGEFGGWNPAGGEADDADIHDLVDGCTELPRAAGAGRVVVQRAKRGVYLLIGRRYNGTHYGWHSVAAE